MTLRVHRAPPIKAAISVPPDKSMSHRAAMLAAISDGSCTVRNFLMGEDCLGTIRVLRQLGVAITDAGPGEFLIRGCRGSFTAPEGDLDCGNSGTTMRLMSGLLAAQPFSARLIGDDSLSRRPMKRIMGPLGLMGGNLRTEGPGDCPPLVVDGNPALRGIEYSLPVASAQVKSAVLLAGLFASGKTTVIEPVATRDHTERMLNHFGVTVHREGNRITVSGGCFPKARDFTVPGDVSSAAFWFVAAAAQPGARLCVRDLGLNPTRTGVLGVLLRMGARIREEHRSQGPGEPSGLVEITGSPLKGTIIVGKEIPNVIDELPVLAVAGALASGTTIIRDAAELRVKESDRLAVVAHHLQAMGADVTEHKDGLEIRGGKPLRGATLPSHGDHRIAMAFAIAGLFADGETVIEDTACVETSYPGFERQLREVVDGRA
ncbi:MAG: 3-phosphoshikimate 1-carboxyvinyltransferase [Chthoniobacterales bacterium]|nr:3-phosphoshikimate 1-carboxyvinyltransferase [Chthoniobacterales bacterium]